MNRNGPPGMGPPGMGPPGMNRNGPPGMGPPGMGPPGMNRNGPPGMGPPGMGPPGMNRPGPSGMTHQRPDTMMPPAKRQKTGNELVPEKEWEETHPGPLMVIIKVPNNPDFEKWNMHGQTLRIQSLITDSCKDLKEKISVQLGGMPRNKQKLKLIPSGSFVKDNKTLAYYNISNGDTLKLGAKVRGGKK
eukprot:TRINITY_DN200_c0_g2_i3.p1 TRINITY_DN200_c0_g2~~TRINITY_DN200_c0_g2_i3.p1  ORF type:complete len:189 (-),score=67.81 TRINITY_DN200_c0_g2_i3:21-587(-)